MKGQKIQWTADMDTRLIVLFPYSYNKVLAAALGVGWRSVVRRARELNLHKVDDFLEDNKDEIQKMAKAALPPNPMKGVKGWSIPNSEKHRYKPGNIPMSSLDPEVMKKAWETRRKKQQNKEQILIPVCSDTEKTPEYCVRIF